MTIVKSCLKFQNLISPNAQRFCSTSAASPTYYPTAVISSAPFPRSYPRRCLFILSALLATAADFVEKGRHVARVAASLIVCRVTGSRKVSFAGPSDAERHYERKARLMRPRLANATQHRHLCRKTRCVIRADGICVASSRRMPAILSAGIVSTAHSLSRDFYRSSVISILRLRDRNRPGE